MEDLIWWLAMIVIIMVVVISDTYLGTNLCFWD